MHNNACEQIKQHVLVFDLETSSFDENGKEIDIRSRFDDYIANAKVKWFGAYSFKENKGYCLNAQKDAKKIIDLLDEHDILVGFNSEEFDYPILVNNGFTIPDKYYNIVDCMVILGNNTFQNRKGFKFKGRGELMKYNFVNNSLRTMAEEMGLETQKGDIDFKIFHKDVWTAEEEEEIKKYLKADVMVTKQMFEKLWDFWKPFTELLDIKYVNNLSWLKNSIASLSYKCACSAMGVEPTYSQDAKNEKEEMGGFVLEPKYEEKTNIFICDYTSLYPNIMVGFNLFAQTEPSDDEFTWHGNDLFQARGYYNISHPHKLATYILNLLEERIRLKNEDPDNPMVYVIKILINSYYGVVRSSVFEKVHTTDAGWDICFLGQQIIKYTHSRLNDFGFDVIYSDTDSCFIYNKEENNNTKDYVNNCLKTIVDEIKNHMPFPPTTFNISVEKEVDYIMWPFSDQPIQDEEGNNIKKGNRLVKERKGRKKNYLYLYQKDGKTEIKIMGFPLIKNNATFLGLKIYEEVLKPLILEKKRAKFSKEFIDSQIQEYLKDPKIMELMSIEYKVKPFDTYKNPSQIQAQISKEYCNGEGGIIRLIKNNKVGKAGKGQLYCSIEEALENKLSSQDLDLTKVMNELEPFIEYQP